MSVRVHILPPYHSKCELYKLLIIPTTVQASLRPVDVDSSADSVYTSLNSIQLTAKCSDFPLELLNKAEQVVHITSRDLVTVVILISVIVSRQFIMRIVVLAVVGVRSS